MKLNDSIDLLNLGKNEYEVLKALGVFSIKQLLLLDYESVKNLCWASSYTKRNITKIQQQLKKGNLKHFHPIHLRNISKIKIEPKTTPNLSQHEFQINDSDSSLQSNSEITTALFNCGLLNTKQFIKLKKYRLKTKNLKYQFDLKRSERPFTFPVPLNVESFCDIAKQKSCGILSCSLPKLFKITKEELDLLWVMYEDKQLSVLNFNETIWHNLRKLYIFKDDPLEVLLSLTVGTLIDAFDTQDSLDDFLSGFVHLTEKTLGHPLQYAGNYETTPFIQNDRVLVYRIHLSVFDTPTHYTKPLQKAGYRFLNDINKVSEAQIVKDMGFNHSSLLVIKYLWKIRPWILCATYLINELERENNAFRSLEDMVITSLESSRPKYLNMRRGATMAVDYMMKSHYTLDNAGQKFNLTREAARQAINKVWKRLGSRPCFERLSLFWILIYSSICSNNGLIYLDDVGPYIQKHFQWEKCPKPKQIKELIKFDNSLIYHEQTRLVYLTRYKCTSCEKMRRNLDELVKRSTSDTHIRPLNPTLKRVCEDCCKESNNPNLPLLSRLLLGNNRDQIKIEGEDIYLSKHWKIKYGDSFSAIDQLMYLLGKTTT